MLPQTVFNPFYGDTSTTNFGPRIEKSFSGAYSKTGFSYLCIRILKKPKEFS